MQLTIPVPSLSGLEHQEPAADATDNAVYLSKPVRPEELNDNLNRLLKAA